MSEALDALILDTHVWFWLATGDSELVRKPEIKEILAKFDKLQCCISAITPWEIAMLEAKQRILLRSDCLTWLRESMRKTRIKVVPLNTEISVESTYLPGEFHGDPADRIIVATARHTGLTLLTRDQRIIEYGTAGFVSVLEA